MRPLIPVSMLALLPATLMACGGTVTSDLSTQDAGGSDTSNPFIQPSLDGGSPDVDAAPVVIDAGPPVGYPAPHPPMPQVITGGGAVMAAPHIIPIVFPNDAFQTDINTFVAGIGATPYWTANTQEYGVGAATGAAVVAVTDTAPTTIDDSAVGPWIVSKITAGKLPAPTANTLYAIYYPASTTVTLQGATSCNQFGGYHDQGQDSNGNAFSYAVIPRCQGLGGLTGLDDVTGASSHEFIEAATDPLPQSMTPAYGQVDDDHLIWEFLLGGGETGDMCAQNPGAFYKPQGFNYTVQRSWSNQQAAASHDPCAPALGTPYFNSAPVLDDVINLNIGGQSITTKGVKIPVGQSKVVELDLYSDAPTSGAWTVKALDGAQLQQQPTNLTFAFDKTSGQNGDKIKMTIKVVTTGMYNVESFLLVSKMYGQESLWAGLVSN